MKLSILSVGKAHDAYIKEGVEQFTKRIGHYYPIYSAVNDASSATKTGNLVDPEISVKVPVDFVNK